MPSFPVELLGEISPERIVFTGLAVIALRWLSIVATADARRRVAVADARAGIEPASRVRLELGEQDAPGAQALSLFLESEEQPEDELSPRRSRAAPDPPRRR